MTSRLEAALLGSTCLLLGAMIGCASVDVDPGVRGASATATTGATVGSTSGSGLGGSGSASTAAAGNGGSNTGTVGSTSGSGLGGSSSASGASTTGASASSSTGAGGTGPINCSNPSVNPWLGSCYAAAVACFNPGGACAQKVESGPMAKVITDTWPDGSSMIESVNPDGTATRTFAGASGVPCFTEYVTPVSMPDGDHGVFLSDAVVSVVTHKDKSINVSCPLGTAFFIPAWFGDAAVACDPVGVALAACP